MTIYHVSSASAGVALSMLGMKHLIFDCPAFSFLREHYVRLFDEQQTVCGFIMNQDSQ